MKKTVTLLLAMVCILNLMCTPAFASTLSATAEVLSASNQVTISGSVVNVDEDDILITVLNEGKTMEDMANVKTGEEYISTIKKQITAVAVNGEYSVTFDFAFEGDEKYVTVVSNQSETNVFWLSAKGFSTMDFAVNHIEYETDKAVIRGKAGAEVKVEFVVLKPGKNLADYANNYQDTVYLESGAYADKDGDFKITLESLPYSQTEGCIVVFKEYSQSYELRKPTEIRIAETSDIKTAMENALKEANTKYPNLPVDVIIPAGEYRVDRTINLSSQYSRSMEAPVTFKTDGKVVINGSKKIDVSLFEKVNANDAIYSRLQDSVKGKVLKINLNGLVPDAVTNIITASFATSNSKRLGIQWAGIYLNDKKQELAKYPNNGYSEQINAEGGDTKSFKVSSADKERMKNWTQAENIIVDGFWKYSWISSAVPVESLDTTNGKINVKWEPEYPIGVPYDDVPLRYRVFNLPEEIDIAGEWYMDETSNVLYYYPGKTLTNDDVFEISVMLNSIITCSADNIAFDGIEVCKNYTLNSSYGEGIIVDADGIVVKNSIVRDTGTVGILVNGGTFNSVIDNCVVYNTGSIGIDIRATADETENRKNLVKSGHLVTNCDVSDTGLIRAGNIGAISNFVGGTTIKNNRIHNVLANGISWAGPENNINNNELYLVTTNMVDTAAIYAGRSWAYYGTKINDNLIHNYGYSKYMGVGKSGNWGIYLDDALGGVIARRNMIISDGRETTEGIYISHGPDNTFDSNIIVNTKYPVFHLWNSKINIIRRFNDVSDFGYDSPYLLKNLNLSERIKLFENAILEKGYTVQQIREELTKYDSGLTYNNNIISNLEKIAYNLYDENNVITNNVAYNAYSSSTEFYNKDEGASVWWFSPGKGYFDIWPENTNVNNQFVENSAFIKSDALDFRINSAYKTSKGLGTDVPDENTQLSSYGIQDFDTVNKIDKSFAVTMPNNGSFVNEGKIQLAWEQSALADGYKYQIATDEAFTNIVEEGETSYTNIVTATSFEKGNAYYLKVTALDKSRDGLKNNKSVNAPVVKFTVGSESDYAYTFAGDVQIYNGETVINNSNVSEYSQKEVDLKDTVVLPLSKKSIDLCYIIAIYNGNNLAGTKIVNYSLKATDASEDILIENIKLPEVKAGYTIKIFRWNTLENLKPIPNVYIDKALLQ